ncbi:MULTISPECIES: MarR family winged helix-turn-helix transcriptional regulator [Vibrio]|uniref:Putative MarR family transcriptional regulator n=1 Tax=Vibrio proteolyticus NBRC 13287 TaxID=1219065 RepID=U3A3Y6_VIBPR|nr:MULTISPECIES: MarR family transcriptional regulator [Vibrio]NAW57457.1 MarR family transcriptional regulator [Vibrio sp. V36_P2S2PM302]NAX21064.1 MarR family transcriptional regulator [Vibrio sp. V39_P1S14PM300]NAX27144.1 MarR family transcriptional regulator [Vibrio sp. V38_P2S17PM301]NAX30299.1 MarR family transcriptional regulator [Vibrio sp. V37_P2S8PM304]GAD68062.1 putative MarR family transcriptional regulator [Vibrio proteolyticus NBRC 13287]
MGQIHVGYLLSDVWRLIRKRFHQDPNIQAMTLSQAKALNLISRHEGIKQVELADLLEIKPMSVVRVIDQLVSEGLVERRPNPNDRRAHLLYLKPAASEQLAIISSVGNTIWADALEGLSEEEKNQFIRTLNRIHHNLAK